VAFLLLLLVPLAVVLAAWFKRRYARAVVQLQTCMVGAALVPPPGAAEQAPPLAPTARPLALALALAVSVSVSAAETFLAGPPAQDLTKPARQLRRQVLVVPAPGDRYRAHLPVAGHRAAKRQLGAPRSHRLASGAVATFGAAASAGLGLSGGGARDARMDGGASRWCCLAQAWP
jgi:hypothetical protein